MFDFPEEDRPTTESSSSADEEGVPQGRFALKSLTQEEEDAYDLNQYMNPDKQTGTIGTIAHLVKGALGAGLLGGHEAFQKAGLVPACILQAFCGVYMTYCIYILVRSAHIIYRRLQTHDMSYSDIGEAALAMCPNPKLAKYHKAYRYLIDFTVCLDLFGCCVCYQLVIAKTIKQLVENDPNSGIAGIDGYPNLRVYLVIMTIPCILISLITNLRYLAPFSLVANAFIVVAILTTVYYSMELHPDFKGNKQYGSFTEIFTFLGMVVFSMSCSGIVIPVCNHMRKPERYGFAIGWGMMMVVLFLFVISIFGMNAYREKSTSPITLNFPLTLYPKILKALIAIMIYITHSLNFYTPFHLCWHYLKKRHSQHYDNPDKMLRIEKIYRAGIVLCISLVSVMFPTVSAIMGFCTESLDKAYERSSKINIIQNEVIVQGKTADDECIKSDIENFHKPENTDNISVETHFPIPELPLNASVNMASESHNASLEIVSCFPQSQPLPAILGSTLVTGPDNYNFDAP